MGIIVRHRLIVAALLACNVGFGALCKSSAQGIPAALETRFFVEKLIEMDSTIETAIFDGKLPGGVVWLERAGDAYSRAHGRRAVVPAPESMTLDTIFDAASLTKVIATAPSIMKLAEEGRLDLDAPVAKYLPGFAQNGKEAITTRQLLTHTSGLRPGISSRPAWEGYEKAIELACSEKPVAKPGEMFRYSDINFILLGELVRVVSGKPLDEFAKKELFAPLGMAETQFNPPGALRGRIAPTELVGTNLLRGIVHDPTARRMGGVAGHAGLFTTAADLARFARMMLNEGELEGRRVLRPETIRRMRSVQTPVALSARRGLGWDLDTGFSGPRGAIFPVGSFGHTGWTGTSIWIDPHSKSFLIFLSNRNHPDESGSVVPLRHKLGTLAAQAIKGFNFAHVPGALEARPPATPTPVADSEVLNGVDVLVRDGFAPLKGLRIGLVTNHTGHDRQRRSTIDLLHQAEGVELVCLFSPEHGIRGELDDKVDDGTDSKTGLKVFSLYGERRTPAPEQLVGLDALVFDIQDIGCRFYTYVSTMGNCMEAAAKAGLRFVVLDRVNPINGVGVEGPVLDGPSTFVGYHPISVRHGMTVGELAGMINHERAFGAALEVVRCEGWDRRQYFDQTGLPWTNPSPNMRNLAEALLYPGIGLLETTHLSVGRGTDTPFEVIGAPYIDDRALAKELNAAGLPGVRFVPVQFTPSSSVFKGVKCQGVYIHLTDRENVPIVRVGVHIAGVLNRLHPKDFGLDRFNRLLVHPDTMAALRADRPSAAIQGLWTKDLNDFKARRESFLLY